MQKTAGLKADGWLLHFCMQFQALLHVTTLLQTLNSYCYGKIRILSDMHAGTVPLAPLLHAMPQNADLLGRSLKPLCSYIHAVFLMSKKRPAAWAVDRQAVKAAESQLLLRPEEWQPAPVQTAGPLPPRRADSRRMIRQE